MNTGQALAAATVCVYLLRQVTKMRRASEKELEATIKPIMEMDTAKFTAFQGLLRFGMVVSSLGETLAVIALVWLLW